jgi:hypothetical protein
VDLASFFVAHQSDLDLVGFLTGWGLSMLTGQMLAKILS